MNNNKTIVVTGATGKQGGAVADHLLKAGFHVRAITRNPNSTKAQKLKQKGAEVVAADLNDKASLQNALSGAYGVFSVQNYWEKGVGYDGEVKQGKNLIEAAKEAGIQHFVQAGIADAEKAKGVMHWECKDVIEDHLKQSGLPYTILGETFFMENFLDPKNGPMMLPFLSGVLKAETRLHMVSVKDIGAVAATVFNEPQRFSGKKVNIAGDSLTVGEMREIYNKISAKKAPGYKIPAFVSRFVNNEMVKQLKWNNSPGWQFEINETRQIHPELTSFRQFLMEQN